MSAPEPISFAMLRSGLFQGLSHERFQALLAGVTLVDLPVGTFLFHEGDVADALYVVLSGAVQVVTSLDDGRPVVLARLGPGRHFGEHGLLSEEQRRMASVRAAEATTLVRVDGAELDHCVAADPELRERLGELGRAQRAERIARRSELVRAMLADAELEAREVTFAKGETLFRQGDEPDAVYVVLSGAIHLFVERDGQPMLLSSAGSGACVGELAALRGARRAATAVAAERTRVLCVRADRFVAAAERSAELCDHLATLERVYALPHRGFVTQHAGNVDGSECVTQLFHLSDGRRFSVMHWVGGGGLRLEASGLTPVRTLSALGGRLEVGLDARGAIARISAEQALAVLAPLVERAIDGSALSPEEQSTLSARGELAAADDGLLCRCLRVTRETVRVLTESRAPTLKVVQELSGCGTVCGSCLPALEELLQGSAFRPVRIAEIRDAARDTRSYRLAPVVDEAQPSALPGQHLVLRARISGKLVERPYTLSSAAGAAWEITVQKEPLGVFSGWLFDEARVGTTLEASRPRGEFVWDGGPLPIVCFVAGIGVTPALAFVRTLLAEGLPHRLVVDWSVRAEADCPALRELETAAQTRENVTFRLRVTRREPRLGARDVARLVERFPSALFYLCGPDDYNAQISACLTAERVAQANVLVERFVAAGAPPVASSTAAPLRRQLAAAQAESAARALEQAAPTGADGPRARALTGLLSAWAKRG